MGIGLSIVFTGLCALVTDGGHGPGQVILVDAQGIGKVDGVMLPAHAPTLVVSLSRLANVETSNPTRVITAWPDEGQLGVRADNLGFAGPVDQIGIWDLAGSEVRIRVQGAEGADLQVFRPPDGASSWPEAPPDANDAAAWRDVRFLANMKSLNSDGRIDPALTVDREGDVGTLPRSVATRVYLEGGLIEAGVPSQPTHRDDIFEFRSIGHEPRLRQALTDTLRWSVETAAPVVVEIVPVTGGPAKRLVLKPGAISHSLFVSNLPAENVPSALHHALSPEEMAALHFGVYYELLKNKPNERPLPRPWVSPVDHAGTGLSGGPFCPPAVFTRD